MSRPESLRDQSRMRRPSKGKTARSSSGAGVPDRLELRAKTAVPPVRRWNRPTAGAGQPPPSRTRPSSRHARRPGRLREDHPPVAVGRARRPSVRVGDPRRRGRRLHPVRVRDRRSEPEWLGRGGRRGASAHARPPLARRPSALVRPLQPPRAGRAGRRRRPGGSLVLVRRRARHAHPAHAGGVDPRALGPRAARAADRATARRWPGVRGRRRGAGARPARRAAAPPRRPAGARSRRRGALGADRRVGCRPAPCRARSPRRGCIIVARSPSSPATTGSSWTTSAWSTSRGSTPPMSPS